MKKFIKISSFIFGGAIALVYLAFLIAPLFINLDNYKKDIQKIVKENSKLDLDYTKLKIYTTPMLSLGVVIENLSIKLPDNTNIITSPKIKGGIALPSLLTLTVKTSKCYVENPNINLEIVDNKQYKIVQLIEDIINENIKKPKTEPEENPVSDELIEKIRIKVPSIKISNYALKVNDLKTSHNLTLKGDELILGYQSKNNSIKVQTNTQLLSDEKENINAKINLSASINPQETSQQDEIDPEETIKIPFINIVEIYQTYDLHADINSNIKIKPLKKHGYIAKGYFNIDNLNLKLSDIRLPNSYLHSNFHGKKIEFDTNIYAKNEEKLDISGYLRYGQHPKSMSTITSDKISFSNLLDLTIALLDSLNIKNNLKAIKASGYLRADAVIDTDFKKLKSNGSILIKNGNFINNSTNIGIKDINADFIFDNNALNIKNTKALINGSELVMNGYIDNLSNTDINININNLSLSPLYSAFAPKELKKEYILSSANLTTSVKIKGKLDDLSAKLNTKLDNFSLSDIKKTMILSNKQMQIDFNLDSNTITGLIHNNGLNFNMPQIKTNVLINDTKINIDNEKIAINPFDLIYNNISKINIKGEIENYSNDPKVDFFVSGTIPTTAISQTLGKDVAYYVPMKGVIPIKSSITGNSKKQSIIAQIYADSNNYISPIDLNSIINSASIIQGNIEVKGDKIKIKNTGLYKKASTGFSDELQENTLGAKQLIDLTAIIDKDHINLLKLTIPDELKGKIAIFKKSSFATSGKITLHGSFDDINYGGDLKIKNLNIPEILFSTGLIDLDLISKSLNLKLSDINLNSSKIDASLQANLAPAKIFKISNINVSSDLIDVDKSMEVLNKLTNYMPPASSTNSTPAQTANIPIGANGKFNIKKLTTGQIIVDNVKGFLELKNNELFINKLTCRAFEGDIKGDISMNLLSGLMKIKLVGNNLNSDTLMADAANLKDTISGTMKFKTDISLKGATYEEQVKSLKGNVWFDMKNGQYGPFAKLENFFLAENIRENALFKNTIGIILTPIATIDSSHYENLTGTMDFNDGIVTLNDIKSQGDILCILIQGNMNLLTNDLDTKVRVRLASGVSDMLGPISLINPVNLVKNAPGLNIGTAKLFSLFTQTVNENEYKQIPDFTGKHTDNNATKFQIVLKGDVAKPLKLVKSFKWLCLQEEYDKAQEFSEKYIKEQEDLAKKALVEKLQKEYESNNKLKVKVEKTLGMDTTAPKVKEAIVQELTKNKLDSTIQIQQNLQNKNDEIKQELQNAVNKKIDNFNENNAKTLDNIRSKIKLQLNEKTE